MKSMFKKILQYSLLVASLFLAASCSKEEQEGIGNGIHQKPNWVANSNLMKLEQAPDWTVTNTSITQSMTATIAFGDSLPTVKPEDLLAAFAGDECVGVTKSSSGGTTPRFYLYIREPQSSIKEITLAYYSSTEQNVRYWPNSFKYATDRILGTPNNPLVLKREDSVVGYPYSGNLFLMLPKDICTFEPDDEIAVFVGDECRVTTISYKADANVQFKLPFNNKQETAHLRYYSSQNKCIYTSQSFPVTSDPITCKLTPMD